MRRTKYQKYEEKLMMLGLESDKEYRDKQLEIERRKKFYKDLTLISSKTCQSFFSNKQN